MRQKKKSITSLLLLIALALTVTLLPTNTITAQAAKKAKTYKVVYKLNGGKNHKSNPKKIKKNKSVKLKNPTKKGYTFKGWYKDKKFKKKTVKVTGSKKAANRTVYAKWVKNKAVKKTTKTKKPVKKPQDTNTGNTGGTKPTTPSKPLENPADMYCIDGRNDTHNWKTELINAGFHYVCACGYDIENDYVTAYKSGDYELASKIQTAGVYSPYLYEDELMPCPGCHGWCNSDAGLTSVKLTQVATEAKYETKCTRCGQVRPDWFVTTSKH